MTRFALLPLIALIAGCASQGATTARAPLGAPVSASQSAPRASGLRHFYLLSPGPSSTLVVTRSDVPTTNQ